MVNYELFEMIPPIRRSRDYHLYDASGKRYLDLFLNYGRAATGHRPNSYSLAWKNILAKGVYSGFGSPYRKRLDKILHKMFPQFEYRIFFENRNEAENLCGCFKDPLYEPDAGKQIWRPFIPVSEDCRELLVLPPGPFPGGTAAVLSRVEKNGGNPYLSPLQLGTDLCLFEQYLNWKYRNPPILKGNKNPENFKKSGPFLIPECDGESYASIFRKALAEGIVLAPGYEIPSLVPFEMSDYEKKSLEKVLGGF